MSPDLPDPAPCPVGDADSAAAAEPVRAEWSRAEPVRAERSSGRRPRRAVRLSDPVGSDVSVLRSTLPAYRASCAAPEAGQDPGAAAAQSPAAEGPAMEGAPVEGPALGGTAVGGTAVDRAAVDGAGVSLARLLDRAGDLGRSADDSDHGWGDGSGTNDERLARDRPPHW